MNSKIIKIIVVTILFLFSWTFAGFCSAAYAVEKLLKEPTPFGHSAQGPSVEEKFEKVVEEIDQILGNPATDLETKASRLGAKRTELEQLDNKIQNQFAETEKKLKDAGLPDEILQRHFRFVKHYENNFNELKANLKAIEREKGLAIQVEIEKAKKHLERVKPLKRHKPLDPNKLPHRTPDVKRKEPRLKKEDFERDFPRSKKAQRQNKPILVASNGSLKGLLSPNDEPRTMNSEPNSPTPMVAQANGAPTADDLAENIEVQFTSEIRAKAQELEYHPVKIYNWVRNNIEFVPTYGSIQGAHMTLLTKQGNAFDTASLLIALLRASNIPARYAYGTIELPIDKVMNWVGGFTDPNSAVDLIASGGIPGIALTSGGKITAVRMEHMWVEAFVDYIPSRGAVHKEGDTWIPLDPAYKQYTYTEGIDLHAGVPFDTEGFLNQIKSTATINETEGYVTNVDSNYIQTTLTNYQTQVQNYINQNMPGATVEDILGKKEIIKKDLGILPSSLPYKTIVTGAKYSEIPNNMRHTVTFTLTDSDPFETALSYTASIPELAGKRITLSYAPATSTDQQIIDSYGGIYNVPTYLVNMKPHIKMEGVIKATGNSIGLGNQQTFDMRFSGQNTTADIVSNNVTAGAYYGIGLNSNKIPKELMTQRKAKLDSIKDTVNGSNIYTDDYIGEILYSTAIAYFFELDCFEDIIAKSNKIAKAKQVSEGIVSKEVSMSYLFGSPVKAEESGLLIDIDRNICLPVSISGDKTKAQRFMLISGQIGSGMEHGIFEQIYNRTGTSAVKALSVANNQGIPIYSINSDNISSILPQLQISYDVKVDIQNAVNAGKIVTVSNTNVTVNTWTGVGYIILDPDTCAGAYMITGGFAGGGADVHLAELDARTFTIFGTAITLLGIASILEAIDYIVLVGLSALPALPLIGQVIVFVVFLAVIAILLYAVWLLYDKVLRELQGRIIYKYFRYLYA